MNAEGKEIEPHDSVNVSIEYQKARKIEGTAEVAHIREDGDLEVLDAAVDVTSDGSVASASFESDSFSYYIIFGGGEGSTEEKAEIGNWGWLKFSTVGTQSTDGSNGNWVYHRADGSDLPAINSDDGYQRILQVRLWKKKQNGNETSYDEDNYEHVSDIKYFWTWENSLYVSDFYLPGYEVLQTKMHTGFDEPQDDTWADNLIGSYGLRGYRSSNGTSYDFNTLDVYIKEMPHNQDAMRYIVRYVHADGSISDGNVRYLDSGSIEIDMNDPREDEKYSSYSIITGSSSINVNEGTKKATINYKSDLDLAKLYIYYEKSHAKNGDTEKRVNPWVYDKDDQKGYYTAEKGLYTNKYAEKVSDNDRRFMVNLESWYVDDAASIGIVLDASGSMAWTAGVPPKLELTEAQYQSVKNHTSVADPIPLNLLNSIMSPHETDNTNMGYNGYKYYIYGPQSSTDNPINEYVALGYTDGNVSGGDGNQSGTKVTHLGVNGSHHTGAAEIKNLINQGQNNYKASDNAGWYYVNSGTDATDYASFGLKRYEGLDSERGPAKFYVKNEDGKHYLYCHFSNGNKTTGASDFVVDYNGDQPVLGYVGDQPVCVKRDQMFTKAETLQDALSQFGAILNSASPTSEVAMTRFSHMNINNLLVMKWSNLSEEIGSALNLTSDATGATRSDGTSCYGLTGGTVTAQGVRAFNSYVSSDAPKQRKKYLIIFTDGKDQGGTSGKSVLKKSGSGGNNTYYLDDLVPNYTIITVFMRSVGMSDVDVASAQTFLQGLADGGKDGDPNSKLFYEANSDDSHEMIEQFRSIANHIVTGLEQYSIRDYIDPRFDVINDAGEVLSVLDSEGKFRKQTNDRVDDNGHCSFRTPDGKQASLGYDSTKKMFYVLWQSQSIPATALGANTVTSPNGVPSDVANLWTGKVMLQAKEDFLGGNDVLTNGNAADENLVYKPQMTRDGEGHEVPVYDHDGLEKEDRTDQNAKPYRSFPWASVNPGLLDVKLGNYEDTLFLGEDITPGDLLSEMLEGTNVKPTERTDPKHRIADTAFNTDLVNDLGDTDESSRWFVEYLERAGKKLHDNTDFYYTILRHVNLNGAKGVESLINTLKADTTNYDVTDSQGSVVALGKANTASEGEEIRITKTGDNASIKLILPYYYLKCPTDNSSYAGPTTDGVDVGDDKVGTLTYEWKVVEFAGNIPQNDSKDEANRFVKFDTYVDSTKHMDVSTPVRYQFSIAYEPAAVGDAASGNDGSTRTKALTGQTNVQNPAIRDVVGNKWPNDEDELPHTTDKEGNAVIHVVDGRILVEKRMLTEDLNKMITKHPNARLTLTLKGDGITSANTDEDVWTASIPKISTATVSRVEGDYSYLSIGDGWATGLPKGTYTLTEDYSDEFGVPTIEGIDDIQFHNDSSDPAYPYNLTVSTWKAPYSGATWQIGTAANGATNNYEDTDYSYADVVNDTKTKKKQVDPLLSVNAGKAYLNAQIGRAVVTNEPRCVTKVEVEKHWEGITPSNPASSEKPLVAHLQGKVGSTVKYDFYKELNADNSWKHTFEDIPCEANLVYTFEEGRGTVDNDGNCSDFQALPTPTSTIRTYTFDGKKYRQKEDSLLYTPHGGTSSATPLDGM